MKIGLFFFYLWMIKKVSFGDFVPEAALVYCEDIYRNSEFDFAFARPRRSRLGDFTYKKGFRTRITVNVNLNPYNFLITYLHEVAHHHVHKKYNSLSRKRVAPHGAEWKKEFQILLQPVLFNSVFPEDVLQPLKIYAKNPKASTGGDLYLYNALKKYDSREVTENKTALIHLQEGSDFVFQNRIFVRGSVRRTRVLCTDKVSQRRYTIPAHALVEAC